MRKFVLLHLLMLILFSGCENLRESTDDRKVNLNSAMSGEADTLYKRATPGKVFTFPEDHGTHPGYKTEWWYFTGNMVSPEGKEFGYQFTIFRSALTPDTSKRDGWRAGNIYMGHFTVTDVSNEKFYFFERFGRDGNGLAGAVASSFTVWLEDWNIQETSSQKGFDFPSVTLSAIEEGVKLTLNLEPLKNIVLQGESGYSRKGPEPGNASYYYSVPRFKTTGEIHIGGVKHTVSGDSWLDREWSTSALGQNQEGWDWFSLHLNNGWEFMYYQLRKTDGTADIYSKGILIAPDGSNVQLTKDEVKLISTGTWENTMGDVYPSGWKIEIPGKDIMLRIIPKVKNQELDVTVKYWEGAVSIEGTMSGQSLDGAGYVELTGYAGKRAQ